MEIMKNLKISKLDNKK